MGALVILVDHDMSLVSACCEMTAVLDFGKLIASGPTAEVLRDEAVMKAYLGTEDVEGIGAGGVSELRARGLHRRAQRAAGRARRAARRSPPAR